MPGRRALLLAAPLLLAACAATPEVPPAAVVEEAHGGGSAIAFAPGGRWLASGGWAGRVRLWTVPGLAPRGGWRAHEGEVTAILPMGAHGLLTTGWDGRIALWDVEGRLLAERATGVPVTAAAADGRRLVTGHDDGSVRIWALPGLEPVATRRPHRGRVLAVAVHGRRIASSGTDGAVVLIDGGKGVRRLPRPPTDARVLAFAPDGRVLLGGGWFRLFRWPLPDGRLEVLPTPHHGLLRGLAWVDEETVLTVSRQTDSAVLVLDAASGRLRRHLGRFSLCGGPAAVADGWVAATSDDGSVRLWPVAADQRRR